jgi:Tol biopolymer transport system component
MRGIPTKDHIQLRIASLDGSGEHLLTTMEESDTTYQVGASWSPDGRTVAIPVLHRRNRSQSVLYGISVADGGHREIFSTTGTIGRPRWQRDGTSMLVPVFEPSVRHAQLWTVSFPSGKRERITNDVSDYSMSLDMTPDGKSAVAAENIWVSHIWASSPGITQLKQITSGESPIMLSALETNSGKLLVRSQGEVWIMDANGTELASFAKLDAHHIRRCGAFVVALVFQEDGRHIVRFDGDGMHIVRLAAGNSMNPSCSPDGKFVFYQDASPPQRILRVPIEGGVPVEIAKIPGDGPTGNLDISKDGRFLEFAWDQYKPFPAMHTSVISSADGSLVKSFNLPSGVFDVRWSIDDHALQYVLTKDGVANIWEQRLSGGPPKQLTQFASGLIFDFSWSKNGKRLLLARGSVTTDVVLLSHLR